MLSLKGDLFGVNKTINVVFFDAGDRIEQIPDNIAIINAELVINTDHLLFAALSAFTAVEHDRLLCKTIAQEFTFNLSPSNNIAESLKRFGEQSKRIAVVDLGSRCSEEFKSWCDEHITRNEIYEFNLIHDTRNMDQFLAVFTTGKSSNEWLSSVAVKRLL